MKRLIVRLGLLPHDAGRVRGALDAELMWVNGGDCWVLPQHLADHVDLFDIDIAFHQELFGMLDEEIPRP